MTKIEGPSMAQQTHSPDPEKIRSMFSKVAKNYDKANSVLSVGIHHFWRKKVIAVAAPQPGMKILDCATGTGDLAIEFKKAVGPKGQVIGTDFCVEMMETAPAKAKSENLEITFEFADVTQLKYPDNTFDMTSISFGIRNVSDPVQALREMARVTKPDGKVVVLEFGQMSVPVISELYNFYSQKVLPKLGGLVSGQGAAYDYLQKSSAAFPCKERFLDLMIQSTAFSIQHYTPVSFGIAYIYIGDVK
jgi:demethylmenaquinone methyltransferase / 2-methoxy-6-polyprenyl-1,4-benzoquinol methylase